MAFRHACGALVFGLLAAGCDASDFVDIAALDAGDSEVVRPDGGTNPADATVTNGDASSGGDASSDGAQSRDARDSSTDTPPACAAPTLPALRILNTTTSTFSSAFFAAQPPGSADWYVVEQAGIVKIIRGGAVLGTPFLDITAAMGTNFGERGLLSIAFHPNYASNGRFFVMGTPAGGNGTFSPSDADAVVEFVRSSNPDVATATKVRDIVVLPASASNHNGGTIVFGPDGYLYVGTGDGGGGCEDNQPGAVQNTNTLFGKILRLDINGAAPFAAPGNPFPNDPRVYHYGLRNPFRFNIDAVTGDLFVGDVGQSAYEEISAAFGNAPGKNFGWPAHEGAGSNTCAGKSLGGPSAYTPPVVSVTRGAGPLGDYASIIGGRVYRGSALASSLTGVYLFADVYGSRLGAVRVCGGVVSPVTTMLLSQIPTPTGTLNGVTSFTQGTDGELYVTYAGGSRLGRFAPQ